MARVLFDFFDSWSDELAWWLGLTLGDGNVYVKNGTYRVSLCGTFETTSRWLALFAPDCEPMEFKRSPGTYQAPVYSSRLVGICRLRFGMCGPKSSSLPWPVALPRKHMRSFLRGLWDSDGSLSIDMREGRRGGPECKMRYSSADEEFVKTLYHELRRCVPQLPEVKIQYNKSKRGKFKTEGQWIGFGWSSFPAWQLAKWLYDDAPEHLRNEDRYQKYLRLKELRGEEYERRILVERRMKKHEAENAARLAEFWSDGQPLKDGSGAVCKHCGSLDLKAKNLCHSCYKKEWRRRRKEETK